jgi:hypothetical protein
MSRLEEVSVHEDSDIFLMNRLSGISRIEVFFWKAADVHCKILGKLLGRGLFNNKQYCDKA